MRFFEWLEHFFEKYGLLCVLAVETLLLLLALIAIVAFIVISPAWRVVCWFGFAGIIIILAVIAYGIVDEVKHIRKL